jgi:hypothetical protein
MRWAERPAASGRKKNGPEGHELYKASTVFKETKKGKVLDAGGITCL